MKTITVASSKGGVGKTTISVSLVDFFAKNNFETTIVDGDVNAPNIGKWFGITKWDEIKDVKVFPLPNKFKNCKNLKILCNGREIAVELEKRGEIKIKHNFKPKFADYQFNIISGDIQKGKTGSGKVVEGVINYSLEKTKQEEIKIIDTAPGTGYPVLTAIDTSNYVVILTEASILGLEDFKKLFSIIKEKNIDYGVIVNYAEINKAIVEEIKNISGNNYIGSIKSNQNVQEALESKKPPIENIEIQSIMKEIGKRII